MSYAEVSKNEILTSEERVKWGQYIIAQFVRVPGFFRYIDYAISRSDENYSYKDKIVGDIFNPDNELISRRNWVILEADKHDYFVRTDNPVYVTGFFENPDSVIFYPLSPKKCFVACSMSALMPFQNGLPAYVPKQKVLQLERGDTFSLNFEFIRSANESIIVSMKDDSDVLQQMSIEVLGVYPQIPFIMESAIDAMEQYEKQEQLTDLMRAADGIDYPYREYPFTPFFGVEFSMGLNPFSIFGVTDDCLPDLERFE